MRSQTYGDKQREAQKRKKLEESWKKSHSEGVPASEPATNADKSDQSANDTKKKKAPRRRSSS
jgi:hypothetical protein